MSDHITVIGNIATDPERRRTATGVPVINFRLASSQGHFDQSTNKWVEGPPNWYSVSAYRKLAEHALESLRKGERVIVTGRFRLRTWESGDKKGTAAEIDADALGHDLLWGTTQYRRDAGSLVTVEASDLRDETAVADAAAHEPDQDGRDRELVAAGGAPTASWSTAQPGGDAPF